MRVSTRNEYGTLKRVIVGSAEQATWPTDDPEFEAMMSRSTYPGKLTRGPLPDKVRQEATADLDAFSKLLESEGVIVHRPTITKPTWSYSARDILLTAGEHLIECPTPFSSRVNEAEHYPFLTTVECKWTKAPRPVSKHDPMFDAANVLKLDDKLLYSVTHSANEAGAVWLQEVVGTDFEVVAWKGVENQITHIDSTLVSLAKDTRLVNGNRINDDNLPSFRRHYKKIIVDDPVPRQFETFPFASKWIGINILSINDNTVVVDPIQTGLIDKLEQEGFKVLLAPLRQSRTLGGGHHCTTCDLERG